MNEIMQAALLHGVEDIRLERVRQPRVDQNMVLLRARRMGICGSDLHYFEHGYCGSFVPTRPFILGHEFTADVVAVAEGVDHVKAGDRVVVNPARACGFCEYCRDGQNNLCRNTIMLGSASTVPPTDGAFAEFVTVRADQCYILPSSMDDAIGAMMEPFAVALHAIQRAGSVSGKRILVTGGGAIGLLVALTVRAFGASPVALSDLVAARRETAQKLAADFTLDPSSNGFIDQVNEISKDGFDIAFEASGAKSALRQLFSLVRPGGTIVQIGTIGSDDVPLPVNQLMVREIQFRGSFRYGHIYEEAIRLAALGRVNLRPLINQIFPLKKIFQAMKCASNRDHVLKVQIENTEC